MFDLSCLFISAAHAADAVAPAAAPVVPDVQSTLMRFVPFFAILLVFYVLLIRPQQKQAEAHDKAIKELKKGDKVILRAGMVGTITKIENDMYAMVEIAKGLEVKVVRDTISGLVDDKHPANQNPEKKV